MPRQKKPADFPAMSPLVAGSVEAASGAASATSTLPTGTVAGDVILVTNTLAAHFTFGATATTADMILPDHSAFYFVVPTGATAFAAIQETAAGTVSVTRMV